MYLSQAVSLPALIGIKSDLFLCTHLVQEVQLEPAVPLAGSCYQLPPQYLCIPGKSIWARLDLYRVGSLGTMSSEGRMVCRNPAHLEVGPYAVYSLRYLIFLYRNRILYLFYLCTCHRPYPVSYTHLTLPTNREV